MDAKTLTPESWITAAFSALADGGPSKVRVEVLAKTLNVTKGSFYWHFRDRNALLNAMLERWRDGRIEAIKQQTRLDGRTPQTCLRDLLSLYGGRSNPRGMAIELAVRDWARQETRCADAVAAVDRERLACVSALFAGINLPESECFPRAYLFYSFLFGEELLARAAIPDPVNATREFCASVLVPAEGQ